MQFQFRPIGNLPVHRRFKQTDRTKPHAFASLNTFNRFNPLRRLGDQMADPFVTTPPPSQRATVPRAPLRQPMLNPHSDNTRSAGNSNVKPRGNIARHRPRKPNGQFAKRPTQANRNIDEDVTMASPRSQPEATGTERLPADPRSNRFRRNPGEARRRVEDVARDLENLREVIPAICDAKHEGLNAAIGKIHGQLSNMRENPVVRGLKIDLNRQSKECERLENGIKRMEDDLSDDRVTLRQMQVIWGDDVARIEDRIRELSWTLGDELEKLKPLVEKHDEAWKWMEEFREKVPGDLLTMDALKGIASRVDQLHERSSQELTVQTRARNRECTRLITRRSAA